MWIMIFSSLLMAGNLKPICIIDTGIAYHEKLRGQISKLKDYTGGGIRDGHGHGTAVAGVIDSLNPNQPLLVCKSCDSNGRCYTSRSIKCVDWCASNGARVINMSFGSLSFNSRFARAIQKAKSKKIDLVASAGNRGRTSGRCSYPGLYKGVTNVGALDNKGMIAKFSSTKCQVDQYRIGVNVRTYKRNGGYKRISGTSFAAPRLAAEIANGSFVIQ